MSAARPVDRAAADLGHDLLSVVAKLNRWANSRATLPIPYAQARMLALLQVNGPARISDLAQSDHCSQPTMSNQIKSLVEAGLVARTEDPDDARAVLVDLTADGRTALGEVRRARSRVIAPEVTQLSTDERVRLVDAVAELSRFSDHLTDPTAGEH